MKKKKIFPIVLIILFIMLIIGSCSYFIISNIQKKQASNSKIEEDIPESKLLETSVSINNLGNLNLICNSKNNIESEKYVFGDGEEIFCSFVLEKKKGIEQQIVDFSYELSTGTDIDFVSQEKYFENQNKSDNKIIYFEFIVDNKSKYNTLLKSNITFKNITIKTNLEKTYKIENMEKMIVLSLTRCNNKSILSLLSKDMQTETYYKCNNDNGKYEEVGKYTCEEKCSFGLYGKQNMITNEKNLISFIYKNYDSKTDVIGDLIIYDIKNNTSKNYKNVKHNIVLLEELSPLTYIYIEDDTNNYKILDPSGNIIKNLSGKELPKQQYEGTRVSGSKLSLENNRIVIKDNNLFGVEEITTDKVIVPYNFESIELNDIKAIEYTEERILDNHSLYKDYYKAKTKEGWNLYRYSDNNPTMKEYYENIYLIQENIIFAVKDNKMYIKDKHGNNLTEETINVENMEPYWPKMSAGIMFIITENGIEIKLCVLSDSSSVYLEFPEYIYNIKNNTITKK